MVLMNPLAGQEHRAGIDTQRDNGLWSRWGKDKVGWIEREALKYKQYHVKMHT